MEEKNIWVDPTIAPRRAQPGDGPREYRPPWRVYPCADVLECRSLNTTKDGEPAPTVCRACGGPLMTFGRRSVGYEGERL